MIIVILTGIISLSVSCDNLQYFYTTEDWDFVVSEWTISHTIFTSLCCRGRNCFALMASRSAELLLVCDPEILKEDHDKRKI